MSKTLYTVAGEWGDTLGTALLGAVAGSILARGVGVIIGAVSVVAVHVLLTFVANKTAMRAAQAAHNTDPPPEATG